MIELRTDSLEGISAPFLIGIFTPDQQIKPGPAEGAAGTGCSIADRAKASEPQTVWAGFTTLLGVVALAAGRVDPGRRDAAGMARIVTVAPIAIAAAAISVAVCDESNAVNMRAPADESATEAAATIVV
ncbi:MAG: hypothetical protein U5N53_12510 [Mycobacterium sp.]|nr:hypothetical protein [Mycobacterium sp.]